MTRHICQTHTFERGAACRQVEGVEGGVAGIIVGPQIKRGHTRECLSQEVAETRRQRRDTEREVKAGDAAMSRGAAERQAAHEVRVVVARDVQGRKAGQSLQEGGLLPG